MNLLRNMLVVVLLVVLAGCSTAPSLRIFWPPPPGELALEYIGAYSSQNSFEKTGFQRAMEKILGTPRPDNFKRPGGVAADGKGLVYVSDNLLNSVRIYDFNNRTIRPLSHEPIFAFPSGLDLDSQGRLYVADVGLKKVLVFGADHKLLQSIGDETRFDKPAFVRVNERLGRIYVTDGEKHRIVVFALDGSYLFTFGVKGDREGQLFGAQGLAIAADNRVFVASQYSAKIVVYDADGKHLYTFGERGDGPGLMEMPKALAFDSRGQLYIVDARKGSLTITSDKGEPLLFLGGGKNRWSPLTFGVPNGIFIDGNDRIYVSDALNQRFTVWQSLTERYLAEHPVSDDDLARIRQVVGKPAPAP